MLGSSSSSPPPAMKYDVFISFRGEDTRDGFTSHLCTALRKRHIETYMDDRLVRGEEISPALEKAIEESTIYVIVFSQGYASSRWCLDELTKIMDCKHRFRREVIPVFFMVDPAHVRHQIGTYGQPFEKHQQRYEDKVQGWRSALNQAANLSGWDSRAFRPESILVKEIVEDIWTKLNSQSINDNGGLVGIDKHIQQVESILHGDSADFRIIGIWGMRGIGKTTIAHALYRKLATQFSYTRLFDDVSKKIEEYKNDGGYKDRRHMLQRLKVLLILDNVNSADQLEDLIGGRHSFGPGSRIIVTSSDKQVLNNVTDEIYEVKNMDFQDSLQLFSLHAFKQNYPIESYMEVSEKVLNYAEGIPLALKVLGYFLYGRTREAWESELQKLEKLPNPKIFDVLKLSFDALDEEQQDIFLDIACFYRGYEEHTAKQKLNDSGFSATIGIEVLKERCLISVLNREIVMHDLIQDMGQEIIRRQGVNDPGKRSRLFKHQDIYQVLKKNEGSPSSFPGLKEICWLDLSNCESLTILPVELFQMKFLKRLDLCGCSSLESLPEINQTMENLTVLILDKTGIQELPSSLHHLVGLEELSLHGCRRLEFIPSSIGSLSRLCKLDLTYCELLETIPSSIFKLKLSKLDLHGCSRLRILPEIMEAAKSIAHLRLTKAAVKELPLSLDHLVGLTTLCLSLCSDLEFLPSNIVNLSLLSDLDCSGCVNLTKIPNNIDRLSSLRELSLQGSGIVNLPESIAHLSSLKSLDLSDCKMLECIPVLPPFLKQLLAFDCPSVRKVSSSRLKLPPDSKEGLFKFHFTNSQELDPNDHSIAANACDMINQDAYRSVLFCFPGSEVPHWFPYRCRGNSVTLDPGSLNPINGDRLIGFALCVVLGSSEDQRNKDREFLFGLKFEYEGMHLLANNDLLRNYFYWKGKRIFKVHHTLVWKYTLESSAINYMLSRARNFNFEICEESHGVPTSNVVECGICPLYSKEKDNDFPAGDYWVHYKVCAPGH
ncbi:protein SUPPRESSOR OF npr1-1, CONSTITUTIVE 1 [Arachis ipaensis]|uniref:protein SUPPRESSOR OF npr1-1, CONSTITUTIVE 1 n=1 Tax=Arachis ipaensis TaxID=130454 RepID=UPI000A2B963B|nr:protein SUPPRESSOR OF npr1-1, CONSTITUTIVE 1 [Arachis ipaensis]